MKMIEAFKSGYKKIFKYSGRATRSEFWYFVLANFLLSLVIGMVFGLLGSLMNEKIIYVFIPFFIFILVNNLSMISLSVRRLHDIGKSGWFYLIIFIPLVGPFVYLYFMIKKSDGNNKYDEIFINNENDIPKNNQKTETIKFITKKDILEEKEKKEKNKNFSQKIDSKLKDKIKDLFIKLKSTNWKENFQDLKHINYGEKLKRIYKFYFFIGAIILMYLVYFIGMNTYSFISQKNDILNKTSIIQNSIDRVQASKDIYKTLEIEEKIFKDRWNVDLMGTFKFRVNSVEVLSKIKEKNNSNSYLVKLNYNAMEKIGQTNLILILMHFKNKIVYADPIQIIFISNDKNN